MAILLFALFFCSGVSGLIYQVIWVRQFGLAFGNTIYSASLVVAIFMLGLGAGSYLFGVWADRRYQSKPDSLLKVYALVEALIGALGLAVSLVLPRLDALVASMSAYTTGADGWHVLTTGSYAARGAIAVLLLAPITALMGGTLTLLIRHLVRTDVSVSGWKIALLYGINTAGAAAGAFLTDFAIAPAAGLLATQLVAVALNFVAAIGAFALARRIASSTPPHVAPPTPPALLAPPAFPAPPAPLARPARPWTAAALAFSGFAAMGLEILWLRHATLLLGGFRAVFSLLLTVMLVGLGAGSLAGGWLQRRSGRPAEMLMVIQALFVGAALFGIAWPDASALTARGDLVAAQLAALGPTRRALAELWFNAQPILMEVALPALLAGFAFPLANSLVQRVEQAVGHRAGLLYLANTAGAVCGSLVTGYVLLPRLGVQSATTVLGIAAALPIGALFLASRARGAFAVSAAVAVIAIALWLTLPAGYILERAVVPQAAGEQRVAVSEGATELIEVVEIPGRGRGLLTNGHAMASTAPLDQRYMRALAHIPLLAMPRPERVLVIGFGVGNSVHAASLHPSVSRIDVADLSRHILDHASYFRGANHDVLASSKVSVYVNDGRQHLQMTESGTYDLITLEPPPIAHAGVAALYSREFYQLARSRLRPGGYVSQWLPAYQVPAESSLAMVRAFVDVFPEAVLLSGTQAELLLLGTTAPRIEIDPAALEQALQRAPAVQDDLTRLDLGSPTEIIGSFVGSPTTLARATQQSAAVTDDRPRQEYGVRSRLAVATLGVPAALFDLDAVGEWCPRCFDGDALVPQVEYLDTYLRLLQQAYTAPQSDVLAAASATTGPRRILGSAYLGAALPASEPVAALLDDAYGRRSERGRSLLAAQRFADAAVEFRAALEIRPDSAIVHNDLGVALASQGRIAEAAEHFARAVALDPGFTEAQRNLSAARR